MSKDPLRKELENIVDTLITDVTNYVDRAKESGYPILFVGKFRQRALNSLQSSVMLKSEHRTCVANLLAAHTEQPSKEKTS